MFFVFDLDFTLWDCGGTWCDHTNPPYYKRNGMILDEDQREIRLYPDVTTILEWMKTKNVDMAIASRTGAPEWADELMELFDIKKFFSYFEIYPGSKINHFTSLHNKTGVPFREMIFYDDEMRNIEEVRQLGVDTVYVENGINLTQIRRYLSV